MKGSCIREEDNIVLGVIAIATFMIISRTIYAKSGMYSPNRTALSTNPQHTWHRTVSAKRDQCPSYWEYSEKLTKQVLPGRYCAGEQLPVMDM